MRLQGLALTVLLGAAAPLVAQKPQTPPTTSPARPAVADALDGYLDRWQKTMEQVQALSAQIKRTEKDQVTDVEKHFTGYTKYLRVGAGATTQNLALLQMTPDGKKDFSERFVCSGALLYEYRPSEKVVMAHELPKPKAGQVSDDNFLSFLFGMKKEEAKKRYDLKLTKTDPYYLYVDIQPRFAADKGDFQQAQIVLNKETMLPRRLWFKASNGTEVTWDVVQINSNDKTIDRREFDAPTPPAGWKMVAAPKDSEVTPRVARPSGGQ
jgi:TIGR03009 family protein